MRLPYCALWLGVCVLPVACLAVSAPISTAAAATSNAPSPQASTRRSPVTATLIPTVYEAGHFYATPVTQSGQAVKLVVDTGGGGFGGMYWITLDAAKRLHLAMTKCTSDGQQFSVAVSPGFRPDRAIPPVEPGPCGRAVLVLPVAGDTVRIAGDGQLGVGYLPSHVWTFDYAAHRLWVQPANWRPRLGAHSVRLGMLRARDGSPSTGFLRVPVVIDGTPLDMLFDTGATWKPTAAGERAVHAATVGGYGVTSFVATSTFDAWHRQHPGWRVVLDGDTLLGAHHPMRLIEVPKLKIAGWSVGPVWFTERPDAGFFGAPHSMSSMLDRKVYGAIGGNVFRHFRVTVDYPQSIAYFHCERGCMAASR